MYLSATVTGVEAGTSGWSSLRVYGRAGRPFPLERIHGIKNEALVPGSRVTQPVVTTYTAGLLLGVGVV